jgi:uncharacterized phiE125 gp8 family phage protein
MDEPITPEIARGRLGLVSTHRDADLQTLIAAARAEVEDLSGVTIVQREVRERLSAFGDPLILSTQPVVELTAVEYVDADGVGQVVAPDARLVNRGRGWALKPAINAAWPGDADQIEVVMLAGYAGTEDDPYPPKLIQAILVLVQVWFEDQAGGRDIPQVVRDLCYSARTWAV